MATTNGDSRTRGKARRPSLIAVDETSDPRRKLRLQAVKNPVPKATLGDLGLATRIAGPREFSETILVQPVPREALVGIDPSTVRMFRLEQRDRALVPVWNSGLNEQLGFAWAKVRRPGVYVPLGLPRDRLLHETLRAAALERRYADVASRDEHVEITQRVLGPLLEMSSEDIDELRIFLTLSEVQAMGAASDPQLRIGNDGAIVPFPLPGDITFDELRGRLKELDVPVRGLAEEALFFRPELTLMPEVGAIEPLDFLPPTPIPIPDPDEPLPKPWPPQPLPPPRLWPPVDLHPFPWERLDWIREHLYWILCFLFSRNWWMYHRDSRHTGSAACSGIRSTNVSGLAQRYRLTLDGPIISIPCVVGGKVYVGTASSSAVSTGGSMYRIDLATGTIEATFTFSGLQGARQGQTGIASSPAITGGRVYFSALTGKVYCLDATTLACLWVTDLRHTDLGKNQPVDHGSARSNGWSSPLVVNGRVYVGFGEGESGSVFGYVYCLDAVNGRVQWLFCTNQFTPGVDNSPNVIPPSAFAGTPPAPFTKAANNPPNGGASPWSSCAYDSTLDRVYIGTGNSVADDPLPDPRYASGILALDGTTGQFRGFFQPLPSDSYRPALDLDVDVPGAPTIFSRGGTRVVGIGSKNGSYFLLDPASLAVLARRQLLPYDSAGNPFLNVDPGTGIHENLSGVFGTAAVHFGLGRLFVGVGGYSGAIDSATTPFLRALDWATLADAWPTSGTNPPRYTASIPPLYTTPNESGISSPAVVNDVVFVSTSKPGLYALDAASGLCLWAAPGLSGANYAFGPAIYGNYVVNGLSNGNLHVYSV
jgi:outer membrane protein assembly factor BamB